VNRKYSMMCLALVVLKQPSRAIFFLVGIYSVPSPGESFAYVFSAIHTFSDLDKGSTSWSGRLGKKSDVCSILISASLNGCDDHHKFKRPLFQLDYILLTKGYAYEKKRCRDGTLVHICLFNWLIPANSTFRIFLAEPPNWLADCSHLPYHNRAYLPYF